MKIAIMQPYFCPYIGYFQLINAVDTFIIADDLQYAKGGWYNRNRIINHGVEFFFTIPLKSDSSSKNINERYLANNSHGEIIKTLRRIKNFYSKAPYFSQHYPLVRKVFLQEQKNLSDYNVYSMKEISKFLKIETQFILSSSLEVDPNKKGVDRVIEICKMRKADTYINPIGGVDLYSKDVFNNNGIDLQFIQSNNIKYDQFKHTFVPSLSIIDIIMFNDIDTIKGLLNEFKLV